MIIFHFAHYPFFCAGFDEGAHQGGISLFETQVHTPTIQKFVLDEPPVKLVKEPVCKRLRSGAGTSNEKALEKSPVNVKHGKKAASPPNAEDSDDDFERPPPVPRRTRSAAVERPTDSEALILSNKRPVQKPSKFRSPVQKLNPARFSYLVEMRKVLQLITSTQFRQKYSESVLFSLVFFLIFNVCNVLFCVFAFVLLTPPPFAVSFVQVRAFPAQESYRTLHRDCGLHVPNFHQRWFYGLGIDGSYHQVLEE